MKKKHNSRNIQHLDKLNSLSKDVLLSGRYIQDSNSNNTGENSNKVLTSFELTKTKSNFLNPLFKQKLFDIYSEMLQEIKLYLQQEEIIVIIVLIKMLNMKKIII